MTTCVAACGNAQGTPVRDPQPENGPLEAGGSEDVEATGQDSREHDPPRSLIFNDCAIPQKQYASYRGRGLGARVSLSNAVSEGTTICDVNIQGDGETDWTPVKLLEPIKFRATGGFPIAPGRWRIQSVACDQKRECKFALEISRKGQAGFRIVRMSEIADQSE